MCRWPLAALIAVSGCALVSSPSPDSKRDLATSGLPGDLAFTVVSNDDMATAPLRNDAGMTIAVVDMARPLPPGDMATVPCSAAQHLVINEVLINGAGDPSDEFIEIYNPCLTADVPLMGWKLLHRSAKGTSDFPTIPLMPTATPKKVPKGGYFLVAGPTYKQTTFDVQYSQAALSATGGGLALVNGTTVVDSMGWGTGATNAYIVGSPPPSPPDGQSLARMPNGSSMHKDDSLDFKTAATPTPRAAN